MSGPLAGLDRSAQHEQWAWRQHKYANFPHGVQSAVAEEVHRLDSEDYRAANVRTAQVCAELTRAQVGRAFDDELIRDHAANYARLCSRMVTLERREAFASSLGVVAPAGKDVTREGAIKRMDDPLWWRRQLRRVWTRAAENGMRDLGIVRKGREPYASDAAVRHRAAMKRRAREFMESATLTNEEGEQLELLSVAEKSLANPALRRGEFMCRVRGFEEIAAGLKHVAEFVTLTTPSLFHSYLSAGARNPTYQRAVVREAQQWLCRMWARARSKLRRLSVLVYGVRIAEPHHDATPHWHLLLFVRSAQADTLREVLRGVWLKEFGNEPGAREHRCKFERIDAAKGSAVGYVAKYVSKNIDGAGAIGNERDDETGTGVSEGIARVDAWASIHGIRQFAQIGGPPVGIWRELRRLRSEVDNPDMERTRRSADCGDWRGFVQCAGGIHAGRRTNIQLEKHETGEHNKYGECRPARVVGLRWASTVTFTRPHRWRLQRNAVCARVRPDKAAATALADSMALGPNDTATGGADVAGRLSGSEIFSDLGPVAITVRSLGDIDLTSLSGIHDPKASDREWSRVLWREMS